MPPQCRLCGDIIYTKDPVDIFKGSSELTKHIALLTGISLSDHFDLPRNMCECCLLSLKSAIAFRELCIKTNYKLTRNRKLLKTEDEKDSNDPLKERPKVEKIEKDAEDEEVDLCKEESDYEEEEFIEELEDYYEECTEEQEELMDLDEEIQEDEEEIQEDEEKLEDDEEEAEVDEDEDWTQGDEDEDSETNDGSINDSRPKAAIGKDQPKGNSPNSSKNSKKEEDPLPVEQKKKRKRYKSTKTYVCDHCGREFNDKGNLNLHVLRHTGVRPFECPECGQKEFNKYILNIHIRVKHRGEKPYACKFCDEKFETSIKRTRHSRRTHEKHQIKPKPYKCSACDKRFELPSLLTKHEQVHSGERKFSCELCHKSFTRSGNLKTHFKSMQHKNNVLESKKKPKPKRQIIIINNPKLVV
ncbi:transcription factor Ouib [Drosophila takahashii]|uniref:transcription factor Ouib n=1 Tax=Drosophila takahashii TaxID=29030 RepID=UPI0038992B2C